jgi:hypothetical protein
MVLPILLTILVDPTSGVSSRCCVAAAEIRARKQNTNFEADIILAEKQVYELPICT